MELKPCPFCGKKMSDKNFFSCDGYPKACGCWEHTHTGDEAIAVWNTRPLEAALQKRVEELGDEVKKWQDISTLSDDRAIVCIGNERALRSSLDEAVKEIENMPTYIFQTAEDDSEVAIIKYDVLDILRAKGVIK